MAVHHWPEPPQGPLALAMVQTGTTAGDGAPDPAPGTGMVPVRAGLQRALPEDMAMVLDPGPGLDPGMDMDLVVVLMPVVMGLEVVRETPVVVAMMIKMVVVTIIIDYPHPHLGAKPTMGKCI